MIFSESVGDSIRSRILFVILILSHTLPKWEAWGGLKIHIAWFLVRRFITGGSLTVIELISHLLTAPTKFVPGSEQNSCRAGTRIGIKHLSVLTLLCQKSTEIPNFLLINLDIY